MRPIAISMTLVLVTTLLASTGALATDSSSPVDETPLLKALAYVPLDAEDLSVEFTSWADLKARHGGSDLTSLSSLSDRDGLVDHILEAEPIAASPMMKDLSRWRAIWGWDLTDLAWQLRIGPSAIVLRFAEEEAHARFVARLPIRHFELDTAVDIDTYRYGSTASGRELTEFERTRAAAWPSPVGDPGATVTLAPDSRTVIIGRDDRGPGFARQAATIDLAAVAESPLGRVAQQLGDASVAMVRSGALGCTADGARNGLLRGDAVSAVRSAGRLQPYEAYGVAYDVDDAGESHGRYVFDYDNPKQAKADLPARRGLLRNGGTGDGRNSYQDFAFRLQNAVADGQQQVFDVRPVGDSPSRLFDVADADASVLAACGDLPPARPLTKHRPYDLPVFAGPATLRISGERGAYTWEETRFGADEVRVKSEVRAGSAPCSTRLRLDDRDGRVATGNYAAGARRTNQANDRLGVEYATAVMRVDSTCPSWSLRLEPVKDPDLKHVVKNKRYTVKGSTIAELQGETTHIDDEYAGQARYRTFWTYWWQERGSSCDVTHGDVRVRSIVLMPKWKRPKGVDPGVVRSWKRSQEALYRHELGHLTINLQGAHAIDERLDAGLSATTCKQVGRKANKAANKLFKRWDKINKRFDERTDHGLKQGTELR